MSNTKSILITGASSGIGKALALHYARYYAHSGVQLHLNARNAERLAEVANTCADKGARVTTRILDVCDAEAMKSWIDGLAPLDLVIANAGISAGTGGGGESAAQTRRILAVDFDGVVNTVLPAAQQMEQQGQGQIAIISSLAGFLGFPGAPAYCAAKAGVKVWGEALAGLLRPKGVIVSVVCPGYIKTPMTDANDFSMPFLMSAEKAAGIIARGLAKKKHRIVFPLRLYLVLRLSMLLPFDWLARIMGRLPAKGNEG